MPHISARIRLAAMRAFRTAAQAFLAVIVQAWVTGDLSITGLGDAIVDNADTAGGVAVLAALTALGWNAAKPVGGDRVAVSEEG